MKQLFYGLFEGFSWPRSEGNGKMCKLFPQVAFGLLSAYFAPQVICYEESLLGDVSKGNRRIHDISIE